MTYFMARSNLIIILKAINGNDFAKIIESNVIILTRYFQHNRTMTINKYKKSRSIFHLLTLRWFSLKMFF